jgi:RNA polymerase sigma factor (sigma-70 family)
MLANAKLLAADQSLQDDSIITRVLSGHTEEYEILIRRYNKLLYKSARGILRVDKDIEDVMQETYIRGYEKLHQFKNEAKFSTWLTRILINCALQHASKSKRRQMLSLESLQEGGLPYESEFENDQSNAIDSTVVRNNLQHAIEAAISQLPAKYRIVFMLREVEQNSVRETAEVLDISEENVKVRLHRARTLLKDMLSTDVNALELFEFHDTRCTLIACSVMDQIGSIFATKMRINPSPQSI